jgi:TATA-box binding protein (TBP) (component of TFIID and TFIIIB)
MITNINYRADLAVPFDIKFPPNQKTPFQKVIQIGNNGIKLLVFSSGKCRLMGLKKPLKTIPKFLKNVRLQSASAIINLNQSINLIRISNSMPRDERIYEPELFPALRLTKFNPLCVNLFGNGKVSVFGLKSLETDELFASIAAYINSLVVLDNASHVQHTQEQHQASCSVQYHQD